jgi:hypothetical protein
MVQVYFPVIETTDGVEQHECCPQCGSIGVVHFEDSNTLPDFPHRCLRCDWKWDGCTFSSGTTPLERLNSVLTS